MMNTQGIKIFIKDSDATDYAQIGCLQSLGDLDLGKRSSKEDGCMDKEVMGKIIGSLKYGSLAIGFTYKPETTAGVTALGVAHKSKPAKLQDFRIELPNAITPETGTGTKFDFPVYVTERGLSFPKDDEMQSTATLEMNDEPTVTAAA